MRYVLFILHEVYEDVVSLAIGNDDADAGLLHFRGCGILGVHATTTEGTLLGLDILREVAAWLYLWDDTRCWVVGVSVVNAVYV